MARAAAALAAALALALAVAGCGEDEGAAAGATVHVYVGSELCAGARRALRAAGNEAGEVQVRAHADPVPATAVVRGGERPGASGAELVITVDEPILGVAPGQTAVVYVGTRVLGQCTIDRTVSAMPVSNAL